MIRCFNTKQRIEKTFKCLRDNVLLILRINKRIRLGTRACVVIIRDIRENEPAVYAEKCWSVFYFIVTIVQGRSDVVRALYDESHSSFSTLLPKALGGTHSAKYVIKTSFDVTTKPDVETTLVIGCIWKFPGRLSASRRSHDVVTTLFTSWCRHNVSTTFATSKKRPENFHIQPNIQVLSTSGFDGRRLAEWGRHGRAQWFDK